VRLGVLGFGYRPRRKSWCTVRYLKGCLHLSSTYDDPLLCQVAHSRFVTHGQLFEFLYGKKDRSKQSSFNWRVRRLVEHGLLTRHIVGSLGSQYVYSIASQGAAHLLGLGEYFASPLDQQRERPDILHAVELNEIQLRLRRARLLVKWVSELEIVPENEWTHSPYAKDYDALVTARLDPGEATFGLEYERSPKSEKRYVDIVEKMRQEERVAQVLYLCANQPLLRLVSWHFRKLDCRVYFGFVMDWYTRLLAMPAFSWKAGGYRELRCLLSEGLAKRPGKVSTLYPVIDSSLARR
jgi:hypothetical protein